MASVIVWKVVFRQEGYLIEKIELPSETDGSLDSISRLLPGGSYTTFRTFEHDRVFRLSDHLERLKDSARLINSNGINFDPAELRPVLNKFAKQLPAGESRIRLSLDLDVEPGTVYIFAEKLPARPASVYETGVRLVTSSLERQEPKAKATDFIASASELRQRLPAGVEDALMVDPQGRLLEGLSSNFFAIKSGEIWTAEEGVLSGITRSMVLDEVRKAGYALRLEPVLQAEIARLDEAFITSSSRAVMPVVKIDQIQIGAGVPGPITRALGKKYQQRLASELERL